ncbi:hypothetical protein M0R04_08015 [Candidatus Dojkabacteria bacterium]|nr:hypothetical protein [Candidatus Dojkabacteria bacterium]
MPALSILHNENVFNDCTSILKYAIASSVDQIAQAAESRSSSSLHLDSFVP